MWLQDGVRGVCQVPHMCTDYSWFLLPSLCSNWRRVALAWMSHWEESKTLANYFAVCVETSSILREEAHRSLKAFWSMTVSSHMKAAGMGHFKMHAWGGHLPSRPWHHSGWHLTRAAVLELKLCCWVGGRPHISALPSYTPNIDVDRNVYHATDSQTSYEYFQTSKEFGGKKLIVHTKDTSASLCDEFLLF